jgi:predicted ABC-type ATPase
MSAERQPVCWIIAGPNGAGKTTFALKYLPEAANCRRFVNADLIAAGMSPLAPERERIATARIYLAEIERHVRARRDFGFETTLSGQGYLRLIARLKSAGWRVELIYLALPNVEMSRLRVAERVAHGGHDIPADAIERRFARSLRNLFLRYAPAVDRTRCYINSGTAPIPVFAQRAGERRIIDRDMVAHLEREAGL